MYAEALSRADRLYLTHIDLDVEGDTFFPDYTGYKWQQIGLSCHSADEKNPYAYRFETLQRQR